MPLSPENKKFKDFTMREPRPKIEKVQYDSNTSVLGLERDIKNNRGAPKRTTLYSQNHSGKGLGDLLKYKFALVYRDQGVSEKPNRLDSSLLSAEGFKHERSFGLRSSDVTRLSLAVLKQ